MHIIMVAIVAVAATAKTTMSNSVKADLENQQEQALRQEQKAEVLGEDGGLDVDSPHHENYVRKQAHIDEKLIDGNEEMMRKKAKTNSLFLISIGPMELYEHT